jgi:acyl-homoserine-lactone acylase
MPKWLGGLLGVLGLVAAVLVGLASWDNLTARGSVADPVRKHGVRIVRDKWGVPHIYGKTDADVAYGLAIAHAEDDFPTLEESIAGVRGRGGAISGADGAKFDFAGAFLNANQVAAQRYGDLSPETRALVEAYARGLNDYASKHPSELRLRGLFPVNGKDIVAGFVLRSPFFFGLDRPLSALIDNQPPPRDSGPPDERGSNGFAVSGRRSSDGVTRLIVNSHQPWTGAVAWYEVVVHSEQGWDFAGALFPGVPTPVVGHNKTLGWTHTVNRPDLIDTFKLTLDAKGENYSVDGKWLPLEKSRVWLRVKFGPLILPIPRTLYGSIYGPVIRNDNGAFAIRHAGFGDVRSVEQWYRLTKARDFAEWQQVMTMQAIPAFNTVYADAAGHIGMFYNARFPLRAKGYDWKGVVPGDTRKTLWNAYYPFAADPMVVDPPAGWVGNSNNNPFLSTAPADEQKPEAFPVEMGVETYVTNRALRYQSLFAALGDKPISRDDLLKIKFDKGYDRNGWAGTWYREVMALDTSKAPDMAAAQKLIGTWDWTLDCKGAADTIVTTAFAQAARFAYLNKPRPDTAAALREAVDLLTTHYGRIDPPLGDFQRLRRGKVDLPLCGGPEALRAIIGELADDGRRVGNNGDGFIMLIEWAPDGRVNSHSIHQYGAATMRPLSKHYADQAPLFATERWKQVEFDTSEMQLKAQEPQ